MTTTTEKSGAIFGAMLAIASEMPSIAKEGKNAAQGYSFRGVDQVFNSLQPIFAKHGVIITAEILDLRRDERPSKSGGIMAFVTVRVRYHFVAKDGSSISTESAGEGCDTSDKATPKALSISLKYALLETFLVPTADNKDPENDSHELALKPAAAEDPDGPALKSLEAFGKNKAELQALGISEDTIWTSIHRYTADTFKKAVVELSEFTTAELDAVNGYLHRRKKATDADRAKQAKEKANA